MRPVDKRSQNRMEQAGEQNKGGLEIASTPSNVPITRPIYRLIKEGAPCLLTNFVLRAAPGFGIVTETNTMLDQPKIRRPTFKALISLNKQSIALFSDMLLQSISNLSIRTNILVV